MTVKFEEKKVAGEQAEKTEQPSNEPKNPQEAAEAAFAPLAQQGRRLAKLQEALQKLEGLDGDGDKAMAEAFRQRIAELQTGMETGKLEFEVQMAALRPEITAAEAKTLAERNHEEMQKYFALDESTLVKNYDAQEREIIDTDAVALLPEKVFDKTTSAGKQEYINTQESDEQRLIRELDQEPDKVTVPVPNAPEVVVSQTVAENDTNAKKPEARKGVIDETVHMEALRDFRKGLKGETGEEGPKEGKWQKSWGWLKERLKGLATLGIYEFRHAERFRSGTKKVAKEVHANIEGDLQGKIQKIGGGADVDYDRRLSLGDALAEAERMQALAEGEQKKELTKADLTKYSEQITQEKIAENDQHILTLVGSAEARITKELEKYKDEFGHSVLTEEKLANFREKMTLRLRDVRRGIETGNGALEAVAKQPDLIRTMVRESLDPKYWRRYVYGGVEVALWALAAKAVITKMGAEQVLAQVPNVPTGPSGFEDLNLHKNVWNTAKGFMQEKLGIANPTNSQILKLTEALTKDNGVGVLEWGTTGSPVDVAMQEGFKLKLGGPLTKVAIAALRQVI